MSTRARTDYIVIHCSATKPTQDVDAAAIDEWHRARGWAGIGYHLVIKRDGTVEPGRPLDSAGAHVRGYNSRSIGVCMVGGIDPDGSSADNFTDWQWVSADAVVDFLRRMYPDAVIVGHRDLSPDANADGIIDQNDWLKDCPCFDVKHRWGD